MTPYAAAEELRRELGLPEDGFDAYRAEGILERASRAARNVAVRFGGAAKVAAAENDTDSDGFWALRDAALSYAARLWVNPEGAMQVRHGDYSRAMADSGEAVTGLNRPERQALRDAFAATATTVQL